MDLRDIDLTLAIKHASISDLSIQLQAPNGGPTVQLVAAGDLTGTDLGVAPNGAFVGTTFDDDAARAANDGTAGARIGHFRLTTTDQMSFFNGLTPAQVSGDWTLTITDTKAGTAGSLRLARLTLTSRMNTSNNQATPDIIAASTLVRGSLTDVYPRTTTAMPSGVGPSASIAADNTLGAFSSALRDY